MECLQCGEPYQWSWVKGRNVHSSELRAPFTPVDHLVIRPTDRLPAEAGQDAREAARWTADGGMPLEYHDDNLYPEHAVYCGCIERVWKQRRVTT